MKKHHLTNNQGGFVLANAMMIMLLLLAVASMVYLVSTKDLRMSSRIQGEKTAAAAAEGGLQLLLGCSNANKGDFTLCNAASLPVLASDTSMTYTIQDQTNVAFLAKIPKKVTFDGMDPRKETGYVGNKIVTGTNTRFNSSVIADVGIAYVGSNTTELGGNEE